MELHPEKRRAGEESASSSAHDDSDSELTLEMN